MASRHGSSYFGQQSEYKNTWRKCCFGSIVLSTGFTKETFCPFLSLSSTWFFVRQQIKQLLRDAAPEAKARRKVRRQRQSKRARKKAQAEQAQTVPTVSSSSEDSSTVDALEEAEAPKVKALSYPTQHCPAAPVPLREVNVPQPQPSSSSLAPLLLPKRHGAQQPDATTNQAPSSSFSSSPLTTPVFPATLVTERLK